MKQEIRQNGKTVLYSGDGHSIPMIFNNLVGKNLICFLQGFRHCSASVYNLKKLIIWNNDDRIYIFF